jgi:hypothetical protein
MSGASFFFDKDSSLFYMGKAFALDLKKMSDSELSLLDKSVYAEIKSRESKKKKRKIPTERFYGRKKKPTQEEIDEEIEKYFDRNT